LLSIYIEIRELKSGIREVVEDETYGSSISGKCYGLNAISGIATFQLVGPFIFLVSPP
jgi:hypothetical protein